MAIRLKRIYNEAAPNDGLRVLVDRVWPRGVSKDQARIDWWLKDIAPSKALRQWFNHDPDKWDAFKTRYFDELAQSSQAIEQLRERTHQGRVTLVYAAKDERFNNAVALQEYLNRE